jgi:hypothetical protein
MSSELGPCPNQESVQSFSHTLSLTSLSYPDTTLSEPGDCMSSESEYFDDGDMYPANYANESAISDSDCFNELESPAEVCLVCKPFHMITLFSNISQIHNRKLTLGFRNWCDNIPQYHSNVS